MKKAISPLISWVLLIGIVVAVGALVSNWALKQAQSMNISEIAEGGLYCDDVALSVDAICKDTIDTTDTDTKLWIKLKNRGNFKINGLSIDLSDSNGIRTEKVKWIMNAGEVIILSTANEDASQTGIVYRGTGKYLKFTPLVDIEGRTLACSEKKVLLTENDLSNPTECCLDDKSNSENCITLP